MSGIAPTLSPASGLLHPGLLEHVPAAWLQQLLSVLNGEDKLAVFKASRHTARLVMHHSPGFRLVLTGKRGLSALRTAEAAITQLLKEVGSIAVQINLQHGRQPFPYGLGPYIHKLILQGPSHPPANPAAEMAWLLPVATCLSLGVASLLWFCPRSISISVLQVLLFTLHLCLSLCLLLGCVGRQLLRETPLKSWLQFNRFTTLKELCLIGFVSEAAVLSRCTASKAGRMLRLEHVVNDNHSDLVGSIHPRHSFQNVANALGASVRVLHVQNATWWTKNTLLSCIHLFPSLHTLKLSNCTVTEHMSVVPQLCEHPTLTTVIINDCTIFGSYRHFKCRSWRSLVIESGSVDLCGFVALPLQALQTIEITEAHIYLAQTAVSHLLASGSKVVWNPHHVAGRPTIFLLETSEVLQSCKAFMPLLSWLSSSNQSPITLSAIHSKDLILPTVWRHIHPRVGEIHVSGRGLVDGSDVWQGMPVHVAVVELWHVESRDARHTDALHLLVRKVPAHVKTLKVMFAHEPILPVSHTSLQAVAPPHVHLSFSWR